MKFIWKKQGSAFTQVCLWGFALTVILRKLRKQRFSVFDVLPVFGVELNGNNPTGRYMKDFLMTKFIDKIVDPVVMAKNDG